MTDFEKLKALLTEFGVGFEVKEGKLGTEVRCECGAHKVEGYSSFFTEFNFNKDGKFICMGAWEW